MPSSKQVRVKQVLRRKRSKDLSEMKNIRKSVTHRMRVEKLVYMSYYKTKPAINMMHTSNIHLLGPKLL